MLRIPAATLGRLRRVAAGAVLAGTVLAAGALPALAESGAEPATSPAEAAASVQQGRREQHLKRLARFLTSYLGLTAEQAEGLARRYGPGRLMAAAPLVKLSGKPVDEVLARKPADKGWKDIARALGLSAEQVRAEGQAMRTAMREMLRQQRDALKQKREAQMQRREAVRQAADHLKQVREEAGTAVQSAIAALRAARRANAAQGQ